jgi:hypothetical protein
VTESGREKFRRRVEDGYRGPRNAPDKTCGMVCSMCRREASCAFLRRGRYLPLCVWCRRKSRAIAGRFVGVWRCESQGTARVCAGRNDGATLCDVCGKAYAEHPRDKDYGFAVVLCVGSLTTFK